MGDWWGLGKFWEFVDYFGYRWRDGSYGVRERREGREVRGRGGGKEDGKELSVVSRSVGYGL